MDKLKYIDLRCSEKLIWTPEFSGSLERLYLGDCYNLVKIHPSIGKLSRLIVLDLRFCCSLINLPRLSSKMESLEVLTLNGCSKLKEIEFEGILKSLSELYLGEYAFECFATHPLLYPFVYPFTSEYLKFLPTYKFDSLRSLGNLCVFGPPKLAKLPEKLWELKHLMDFQFRGNVMREICHSLLYKYLSHYSVRNLRIFQLFKLEVYGYDESAQLRSGITLPKKKKEKKQQSGITSLNCQLQPTGNILSLSLSLKSQISNLKLSNVKSQVQGLFCPKTGYKFYQKEREWISKSNCISYNYSWT